MATYAQSTAISPNKTTTSGRNILYIVIHTMEAPEKPETAENIARGWFSKSAARSSAHWCFDNNSRVRCVQDKDVAWAAPGANSTGLQYELAGYAGQGATGWIDQYSSAVLDNVAQQAAQDAKKYGIPIIHLTKSDIRAGKKGFIGHVDATNAFRNGVGHTDPGPNFPWDRFLALVRKYAGQGSTVAPVSINVNTSTNLYLGSTNTGAVKKLQGDLNAWCVRMNYKTRIAVDGSYGPATANLVKSFQKATGLVVDGAAGPKTQAKLKEVLAAKPAASKPASAAPASSSQKTYSNLYVGSKETAAVRDLQTKLNKWCEMKGYKTRIAVDGSYGPATVNLVKSFQKATGLTQDGAAGSKTRSTLDRVVSSKSSRPSAPVAKPSPATQKPVSQRKGFPNKVKHTTAGKSSGITSQDGYLPPASSGNYAVAHETILANFVECVFLPRAIAEGRSVWVYEDGVYDKVDYSLHVKPGSQSWHRHYRPWFGYEVGGGVDLNVSGDEYNFMKKKIIPEAKKWGLAYHWENDHLHMDVGRFSNDGSRWYTGGWEGNPNFDATGVIKVDGDFGPTSIKGLQKMLNKKTGSSLKVDGVWGTTTTKALQKFLGVSQNGNFDATTQAALCSKIGTKYKWSKRGYVARLFQIRINATNLATSVSETIGRW